MIVTKRDGQEVEFKSHLIFDAVYKAAQSTGYSDYESHGIADLTTMKVVSKLPKKEKLDVEEIQDVVQHTLMVSKYKKVAEHYISYRKGRDIKREEKSSLIKALGGFLNLTEDTYARENVNKDPVQIVTHRDLIAGIVSKQHAKNILPKHIYEAHEKGILHLHDQDYLITKSIHNCGVYNFEYMLANGVKLGDVEIESPKSVGTAANVMCQILAKISGSSYGGQSVHEFDKVMKPYVEKSLEKLRIKQQKYNLSEEYVQDSLRKEVYDACQLVLYQVQTVSSPNGQSSFFSMSLSLSTDPICKMIKEEYLRCHTNGIGPNHKSPIFPKVLYFVEEGVNLNEGDPNYEEFQMALTCSSKHLYPDYVFAPNNRKMTGFSDVVTPMGRQ